MAWDRRVPALPERRSFLDSFDFTAIEEMDPSLAEGHRVVYDRECPFELRVQDESGPQEVPGDRGRTPPEHCPAKRTLDRGEYWEYQNM